MKPLKVNADYEVELFHKRPGPDAINQTVEFFLFFLNERILFSKKNYSEDYLKYVETISGHKPVITSVGPYENFWGPLKELEIEKWWNSKLTSTELIISQKWCERTFIVKSESDLNHLDWTLGYLLKDPNAMSGQKFQLLRPQDSIQDKMNIVSRALISGPQIIEPWFDRKFDFSQYVFPDGKTIAYQNRVDTKFQYKGSIFSNHFEPYLENLSFYSQISQENWQDFKNQTSEIIQYYAQNLNQVGYSIDSFVYLENGELKIRVMSEINYRFTMGRVAYELSQKYASANKWASLILIKPELRSEPLWKSLHHLKDVIVLSPGDSRFDILFLSAKDENAGVELLANTELAVKL
jgi:hypothetical protein